MTDTALECGALAPLCWPRLAAAAGSELPAGKAAASRRTPNGDRMTFAIRRAVVIGSGTMGGGIAAHFANARVPVYLLDISQQIVTASLERLKKSKPPAFFTAETAELVTIGNLNDNEACISEGDWII